jgi:hypothetical protein
MLFNPAHTVLNQQASARESSVDTTNLIGHWDPNHTSSYNGAAGGTTYNNLVTSKEDLKIYGATFNWLGSNPVIEEPFYFSFDIDVTDPYNDNFQVDARKSFAISMWLKFDNFSNPSYLWTLGDGISTPYIEACIDDDGGPGQLEFSLGDNHHTIKKAVSAGIWYMVTFRLRHPEANRASVDLFLDGIPMEVGSASHEAEDGWPPMGSNYITATAVAANDLDIGFNDDETSYMNNATKLGAVMVHQSAGEGNCLPNSKVLALYLATKTGWATHSGGFLWSYK